MKREFDLSFKQDIIDGKVKVVTDCGEPVEIVKWNCKGNYPILAVIDDGDTSDSCFYDEEGLSPSKKERIYVLTDEPELTKFEEEILMTIHDYELNKKDGFTDIDSTRKHAKRILNAAKRLITNEQKPAWSEEDESTFTVIGSLILDNFDAEDASKALTWLHSLRPNHWKPSDEQMEALKFVIKSLDNMFSAIGYMDNYTKPRLKEILEELKKLREE